MTDKSAVHARPPDWEGWQSTSPLNHDESGAAHDSAVATTPTSLPNPLCGGDDAYSGSYDML